MDVIVQRSWMIGAARDDRFQPCEHLAGRSLRRSVLLPVIPRHGVHHRICVERPDIRIVCEARGHGFHGRCVQVIERLSIAGAVSGIARGQGFDERALARVRVRSLFRGLLNGRVRQTAVVLRHWRVEIRAECQRLPPIRHRESGIESGGFAKGADRLGVVEGVQQAHPLIEEALRARNRRRHRHVQCPQS